MPHYPPHYPHLVAARRELESWLFFYFEPRERMRAVNPIKEVRHIGLMGEELAAFLRTLKALEPRQFEAVEKALRTVLPDVDGIEVEVSNLGEVELRLEENGVAIPARVLSEGTLRILMVGLRNGTWTLDETPFGLADGVGRALVSLGRTSDADWIYSALLRQSETRAGLDPSNTVWQRDLATWRGAVDRHRLRAETFIQPNGPSSSI